MVVEVSSFPNRLLRSVALFHFSPEMTSSFLADDHHSVASKLDGAERICEPGRRQLFPILSTNHFFTSEISLYHTVYKIACQRVIDVEEANKETTAFRSITTTSPMQRLLNPAKTTFVPET